jgi:hypothetical protein
MAAEPPFTDHYAFTGPAVAISCVVDYDPEQERYIAVARGGGGWTGFSSHSAPAAALNCFRAWMLDEGGYHQSMGATGG